MQRVGEMDESGGMLDNFHWLRVTIAPPTITPTISTPQYTCVYVLVVL